ncbi:unnamed protein product, partial [Brassica oleracea var. botrytis]
HLPWNQFHCRLLFLLREIIPATVFYLYRVMLDRIKCDPRLLNLTLGAPELDKTYFWANPRRLPKRFSTKYGYQMFQMPHVTWSDDNYYLKQVIQCDHFLQEIPQNSSCLRSAETKSRNGAS